MRELDLTTLRLFIAVCEARSISRVAADETLVVSAISKRLTQLEEQVGAKLLMRGKTGVKPTVAGETLLQHAYELREKLGAIERDMGEHAQVLRGRVRLFAAATAVAAFLPEDLGPFLKAQPHRHIRVDLEEHLSHQVVFGIRQGSAQLGICWDVVDTHGLQTREYRHDELGIVAHRSHPLAAHRKLAMRETLEYEHIGAQSSAAFQAALARDPERLDRQMHYRATVGSFDAAIRLAAAGLGITVAPRQMLSKYRQTDGLVFIPLSDPWAQRRFVLCAQDFDGLPKVARMLADHLSAAPAR